MSELNAQVKQDVKLMVDALRENTLDNQIRNYYLELINIFPKDLLLNPDLNKMVSYLKKNPDKYNRFVSFSLSFDTFYQNNKKFLQNNSDANNLKDLVDTLLWALGLSN
jgi:hypothetical protein